MVYQPFIDHYEVLGFSRDASDDEIQRTYEILSPKRYPDKNNGTRAATKVFQKILQAKEILSDPDHRRTYNLDYDQHVVWSLRGSKAQGNSKRRRSRLNILRLWTPYQHPDIRIVGDPYGW